MIEERNPMTRIAFLVLLSVSLGACSAETAASRRSGTPGGGAGSGGGGGACMFTNLTQACSCGNLAGRQLCGSDGQWSACDCLAAADGGVSNGGNSAGSITDPPDNKKPAHFVWLETDPSMKGGGACMPGHYEGKLDGVYQSPVAFTAPVPIVSIDVTGKPGLQFDLGAGGNGEFLTVKGGHLEGTALATFPFRADIQDGQLDCASGMFKAKLVNGSYDVFFGAFIPGQSMTYMFTGYMVARYDGATRSFVDGRWSVAEGTTMPPAISPGQTPPPFPPAAAGGTGTWTTTWVK
jgi:hypothetical protein